MPEVSRKQASRGALSLLFGVDNDVGREGQPKYIGRGRTVSIYGVVWVESKGQRTAFVLFSRDTVNRTSKKLKQKFATCLCDSQHNALLDIQKPGFHVLLQPCHGFADIV